MPSTAKTLYFLSSTLASAVSVGVLGYSMSIEWAEATMDCTSQGGDFFNGTAFIRFMLFSGSLNRAFCPLFGHFDEFEVIPQLVNVGTAPVVLHALVLLLLALCLFFSASSILIGLYNSVSNPYETYMGPIGVYVCSSLSAILSVVVLIMFVVNIHVTNMAEGVVESIAENIPVDLKSKSIEMQLGYYLVILYTVLTLTAIGVIYSYDHAAYKHRREQQKPTEDAPKEIMMY